MRICFTSDLHGAARLYEELDALLERERPDVLLLGGDLFPDAELHDPLGTQGAYVRGPFAQMIARWRTAAPKMRIACILGNHDFAFVGGILRGFSAPDLTLLDVSRPWEVDGVRFLGYWSTPPTPFWVKDHERLDDPSDALPQLGGVVWDEAANQLRRVGPAEHFGLAPTINAELLAAPRLEGPWIFVCHAPPFGCALDRLPNVEQPVGSRSVRTFITRHAPLCALHGHIHESPGLTGQYFEMIGSTLCVNPGQTLERLHAVVFDPADLGSLRHTVYP